MEIGGGRRLSLADSALVVEVRSGRSWIPARTIGYDEITAVYSYETRDWSYLGVGALYWVLLLMPALIAATVARWPAWSLGVILGALTLVVAGLVTWRISRVPRRLLKLDAYGGILTVPNRQPGFFADLAARLPRPDTAPDPAGYSPSGAGSTPAESGSKRPV